MSNSLKPRKSYDRYRVAFKTSGISRVDQSQREHTDINKIVARAQKTGQWPYNPRGEPFYADASNVGDLMSSFEVVQRAEAAFASLPAEVRRSMDNDPRNLEEWLSDPKNLDQAVKAGLLTLPPQEASPEPGKGAPKAPKEPGQTQPAKAPKTSQKPKGDDDQTD